MTTKIIPVKPFDLIVFGGTGDLARRKIVPALYNRYRSSQIPDESRIILVSRSDIQLIKIRELVRDWILQSDAIVEKNEATIDAFLQLLHYQKIDASSSEKWTGLSELLENSQRVRAFYLAVAPSLFEPIIRGIYDQGCYTPETRVVIEKPLGHDLASAQDLNKQLFALLNEKQIYRIDHYLGKETVQNLMALRFANTLFEPVWRSEYIDHVQITVAEDIGVGGRGKYYDDYGAIRDMLQNHLLQLLCLTAMEPPDRMDPNAVRDEKAKVLRGLGKVTKEDIVIGQYSGNKDTANYCSDVGLHSSKTETFVSVKAEIDNWRWSGTPFYLRTGKRLKARSSEVVVVFKSPPHWIFSQQNDADKSNELHIRLQPDEGINLNLNIKDPGPGGMRLSRVPLDMTFADGLLGDTGKVPDAYERLIMDVIRGDQTLFMRYDEVEEAWRWVDHLYGTIAQNGMLPLPYENFSSGPGASHALIEASGRNWLGL